MKKLAIAGVLLAASTLASAYTWDQTIDFNPDPQLTSFSTYTFSHNLTASGFNASADSISGYNLTINLYNNEGKLDVIYIDQPGLSGDSAALLYNWNYASITTGDSYQGIASLNNDGSLSVSIKSLIGTFFLDSSKLSATGTQATSSVPEPASAALLAAGLFGIVLMRRNSHKA